MSIAISALALSLASAERVSADDVEETIPVRPGGTLGIDLDRGVVRVSSHDANEVRIEAHASGFSSWFGGFDLTRDGNDVHLQGEFRHAFLFVPWGPRVTVNAWVPREYSVVVHTRGGSIDVHDITGRTIAKTSGGSIDLQHANGPASLETSGGPIRAEAVKGSIIAKTAGGGITLEDVDGNVEVETSGGPVTVKEVTGRIEAKTSGGGIDVSFIGAPSGDLHTSGGGIAVAFPSHVGVDLDAETSGGRVVVEQEIALSGTADKRHVVGKINGGGAPLRLHTSGGSIRVRAL